MCLGFSLVLMWMCDVYCSVVGDVMSGISLHEFMPRLEPFLRRVVRQIIFCPIRHLAFL